MLKSWIAISSVLVVGCSSANDDPPPPTQCQRTDRSGTYRQSFQKQGGTCGNVDDQIVSFDSPGSGGSPGVACKVTSERWSENDCKLERTLTCGDAGGSSNTTAVTRQQTQNGSTITGSFSVNVRLSDGTTCNGTYGITFVRQ